MRSLLCPVVIILFCVIACSSAHGDHYHEDDGHGVDAIQRGKEKWFKQPEEIVHHDHDHHHHDHDHQHDQLGKDGEAWPLIPGSPAGRNPGTSSPLTSL